MRFQLCRRAMLALALFVSLLAQAQQESQPLQSDWMELVKGHRDPGTGIELRDVTEGQTADARTVTLAIPKSSMRNPDVIEEVIVIGRRPEKPEPLDISFEWVEDVDSDNYGLIIRLGKDSNWPIRLYLDSAPGYINR